MSATDVEFRPEAAARLESYLRQVRAALDGAPGVSAGEVEGDIREHVAAEFRAAAGPVGLPELEVVLARLGPPAAWRPAGAAPAAEPWDWRGAVAGLRRRLLGVAETLWRGPEDWRLAYLAFGLTALGVLSMGLLLPFAYLVARAAVALAAEKGAPLGARRWLVYPPLVVVSVPLLVAALLAPVAAAPLAFVHLIEPAEMYGDALAGVDPDGAIRLRPGSRYVIEDWSGRPRGAAPRLTMTHYNLYRIGAHDDRRTGTPRLEPDERGRHEWVLRLLRRAPGSDAVRGPLLAAFVGAGALFFGWVAFGTLLRAAPEWSAAVLFPLVSDATGFGRRLVTAGAVGLIWWGAAGWALAEAPPREAPAAAERPW